jgi:lipopolysaccharide transport system ATP-binding protein
LNRTAGRARFSGVEIMGASGVDQWTFRAGERIGLRFGYEVHEAVDNLGFILTFASPSDGQVITNVKELILPGPAMPGTVGDIVVELPDNRFRPGEFSLTACLGNYDFSVFEDILDNNVGMPHLVVESEEEDWHRRSGYFSVEYHLTHRERGSVG